MSSASSGRSRARTIAAFSAVGSGVSMSKLSDKIINETNILTPISDVAESRQSNSDRTVGVDLGESMVGKSKDPKGTRITVRISDKDLQDLQDEAKRRNVTVGAVVRFLIRENLSTASEAR